MPIFCNSEMFVAETLNSGFTPILPYFPLQSE